MPNIGQTKHDFHYTSVKGKFLNEKSHIEHFTTFLNDVIPTPSQSGVELPNELVQWARFLKLPDADVTVLLQNQLSKKSSFHRRSHAADSFSVEPLILAIGYPTGVQLWALLDDVAIELLSLREGPLRIFNILPTPLNDNDKFKSERPLVVYCKQNGVEQAYSNLSFYSLRTGEKLLNECLPLKFHHSIIDVSSNTRVLVVSFNDRLAVFLAENFQPWCTIITCSPNHGRQFNPVALSDVWLAYSEKELCSYHQSGGGMSGDGTQSYAAAIVRNAAMTIGKGVSFLNQFVTSTSLQDEHPEKEISNGIVSIIDITRVTPEQQIRVDEQSTCEELVAHFPAHAGESVSSMAFDPSGCLLVTSGSYGQAFNVFRIVAHTWTSSSAAVHHLYILRRGETSARVQNISFTIDSRWIAVNTFKGTTHLFPINPYGGRCSVRTHTTDKVVNRENKFHTSAGLDELQHPASQPSVAVADVHKKFQDKGSPINDVLAAGTSKMTNSYCAFLNGTASNPRIPPYPHPVIQEPLQQIKQPFSFTTLPLVEKDIHVVVAAFGLPRFNRVPFFQPNREYSKAFSVYLFAAPGILLEHSLRAQSIARDELEVLSVPIGQWILTRSTSFREVTLPLHTLRVTDSKESAREDSAFDKDEWLSQIEMLTHSSPHRRLWMGPQFSFKKILPQSPPGPNTLAMLNVESNAMQVQDLDACSLESLRVHPFVQSEPLPISNKSNRGRHVSTDSNGSFPMYIEVGSGSYEKTPNLLEMSTGTAWDDTNLADTCELIENNLIDVIADAMTEPNTSHQIPSDSEMQRREHTISSGSSCSPININKSNVVDLYNSPYFDDSF